MTEAMPFLRKLILLSYDPRPCAAGFFYFTGGARAYPIGTPARPKCLAGERRSDRMSEPCRLRRGEGYGVRDDEASRSRSPAAPDRYRPKHHWQSTRPCAVGFISCRPSFSIADFSA